jgi:hypothetical protein
MELRFGVPLFHFVTSAGTREEYAHIFGDLSSVCFFLVYVPQFLFNYRRRSVMGFSLSSVVLKLFGSSFLFVNSVYREAPFPYIIYGLLNTVEHSLFLAQFLLYGKQIRPLLFIATPILPWFICEYFPELIKVTDLVKPVTQLISSVPQLLASIAVKTTTGLSMYGQHLHLIGSILGFMMLLLQQNFSFFAWFLYATAFFQAYSIYILAAWYGELRLTDESTVELAIEEGQGQKEIVRDLSDEELLIDPENLTKKRARRARGCRK